MNLTGDTRIDVLKVFIDKKLGAESHCDDEMEIPEQLSELAKNLTLAKSSAPLDRLRLVFNGQVLKNDETLKGVSSRDHTSRVS